MELGPRRDPGRIPLRPELKPLNLIVIGAFSQGRSTFINMLINVLAKRGYRDSRLVAVDQTLKIFNPKAGKPIEVQSSRTIREFDSLPWRSSRCHLFTIQTETHLLRILKGPGIGFTSEENDTYNLHRVAEIAMVMGSVHGLIWVQKSNSQVSPQVTKMFKNYIRFLHPANSSSRLICCFTHAPDSVERPQPEIISALRDDGVTVDDENIFMFDNECFHHPNLWTGYRESLSVDQQLALVTHQYEKEVSWIKFTQPEYVRLLRRVQCLEPVSSKTFFSSVSRLVLANEDCRNLLLDMLSASDMIFLAQDIARAIQTDLDLIWDSTTEKFKALFSSTMIVRRFVKGFRKPTRTQRAYCESCKHRCLKTRELYVWDESGPAKPPSPRGLFSSLPFFKFGDREARETEEKMMAQVRSNFYDQRCPFCPHPARDHRYQPTESFAYFDMIKISDDLNWPKVEIEAGNMNIEGAPVAKLLCMQKSLRDMIKALGEAKSQERTIKTRFVGLMKIAIFLQLSAGADRDILSETNVSKFVEQEKFRTNLAEGLAKILSPPICFDDPSLEIGLIRLDRFAALFQELIDSTRQILINHDDEPYTLARNCIDNEITCLVDATEKLLPAYNSENRPFKLGSIALPEPLT